MGRLDKIKAWAGQHEKALLGGSAAAVAGIALYHRNHADTGAAAGTPTPATTAGLSSPNTSATDIENAVQDQLNEQQSYMDGLLAKLRRAQRKLRKQVRAQNRKPKPSPPSGPTKPHHPKKPRKPKPSDHSPGRPPVKQLPRGRHGTARAVPLPKGAPRHPAPPSKRTPPR